MTSPALTLSTADVARIFHTSAGRIRIWCTQGQLPGRKDENGVWVIDADTLIDHCVTHYRDHAVRELIHRMLRRYRTTFYQ